MLAVHSSIFTSILSRREHLLRDPLVGGCLSVTAGHVNERLSYNADEGLPKSDMVLCKLNFYSDMTLARYPYVRSSSGGPTERDWGSPISR